MELITAYPALLLGKLAQWWAGMSALDKLWLGIGMLGQLMFTGRWFVQWLASERARRSVVPSLFWYFSFFGGLLVMAYGIYRADPVIIIGQFGVFIYARNIYFLMREQARGGAPGARTAPTPPG